MHLVCQELSDGCLLWLRSCLNALSRFGITSGISKVGSAIKVFII